MSDNEEDYLSVAAENDDVPFALTPARATDEVIDYRSKQGSSIWDKGKAKLSGEPFDCTPEGLRDFLELLQTRGGEMGWDTSVLGIPDDYNDMTGPSKDYLDHYGSITLEHLKKCAETYVNASSRAAQDSYMMFKCIHDSLSKIGRDKVTLYKKDYIIGGTESGILFLKIVVRESHIDTNATTSTIRDQLIDLHAYLAQVNFDVSKMNQHAQQLLEALRARGETTQDLLNNLFKAYKTVQDEDFINYIKAKESDYHEGTIDLNADRLMLLAKNKYRLLVDQGTWQAPTVAEEKIIALEAKLAAMKKTSYGKTPDKNKGGKKNPGKGGKGGGKDKKNRREKEPWMLVKPKDGEPTEKKHDGKTWHFCTKHASWCLHTTAQCKGIGFKKVQFKEDGKTRLIKATQATVRFDEDDESDSE
jgi:hypothetical protein